MTRSASHATTLQLPATAQAPARARSALREACAGFPPAVLDDALLLVSELVTNSVLHGPRTGTLTIAIQHDRHALCVAVGDQGAGDPQRQGFDTTSEHGRGLLLLRALSAAWGVRPASTPPGKTVWFRLVLP